MGFEQRPGAALTVLSPATWPGGPDNQAEGSPPTKAPLCSPQLLAKGGEG